MTDPHFTEEHEVFRKQVRAFVERELAPHAEEWERAQIFPAEVFRKMGSLGFLGPHFPESVGGGGGDWWHACVVAEELPRSRSGGLTMAMLVQSCMATPVIADLGTPEQHAEFLTPALRGERIAALGISEPGAGSDVAGIRTTARRVGDDFVINGQKTFITNGTRADFVTLAVKTNPEIGYGGVSLVLFPTDVKGFHVGRKLAKIGNHASDTAELFFEDCRVPARYLLGQENQGFYYVMRNFQGERLIASVSGVAGSQLNLDKTIEYCRERQAFGRPIVGFQVWRHRFVQLMTELEAARRLTYHAVDLYDRKVECTREVTMAKLFVGDVVTRCADECLQAHGGWGYLEEYDVARAWRDTRLFTIGGGTSEIMREILTKLSGL
ncbi:MAG: acyl-CoA dehydrogenase family protein [Deltaproteobacteria bacterium]|nr:acyl-CoA dehydrogenase family protein [Deltaproteobacteria bacterium]